MNESNLMPEAFNPQALEDKTAEVADILRALANERRLHSCASSSSGERRA